MLLFSPPRCDFLLGGGACKQTAFTSRRFSLPLPARPSTSLVALRSLQVVVLPQATPHPTSLKPQGPKSTQIMSSPHNTYSSPRSPPFSPTLGSIQEVFEYEPLDEIMSQPTTPLTPALESPDASQGVLPEPATTVVPTVSIGPKTKGIILSPRKARSSHVTAKVTNVLRHVLEADRLRRRKALRIYLKAIVFLKLLLKSHERYGALMATSGMYMQR
ncbi:hypothetical protein EK21DRAFT_52336 [Setomelanomma holmii]|uniref:Uncharacterized protein n=1 Tax=Setomelanomma holmii TaxID=210430 RepID=A0A9P4LQL7_9PLEO|nr:hypothetical protein EK21DRAFT_52336 [Setomelanomma holmii]